MLICCPYPDCLVTYELEVPVIEEQSLGHALCPQCHRKSRARSLASYKLLQEKLHHQVKLSQPPISCAFEAHGDKVFQVLLEDMRSLWNVGSIFRTADAAGVSMLYLCGITGCPPRAEITKTALGAEKLIPWQYLLHPLDIIPALKAQGIYVIGLERNIDAVNLSHLLRQGKIRKPLCLAVGNENRGLSPETQYFCDYICSLPMQGKKESLNAAVAFGVAAYFINEFI